LTAGADAAMLDKYLAMLDEPAQPEFGIVGWSDWS
jgi:hypothetical protein